MHGSVMEHGMTSSSFQTAVQKNEAKKQKFDETLKLLSFSFLKQLHGKTDVKICETAYKKPLFECDRI